jgi:hypothetical protein
MRGIHRVEAAADGWATTKIAEPGLVPANCRVVHALAVCQDELVIRTLNRVLTGAFDVQFLLENRPLARRLIEDGVSVTAADPTRMDSYLRADLNPTTVVILEDNGRRSLKRMVTAIRDAGGSLIYVLEVDPRAHRKSQREELRALVPEITHLDLAELLSAPLTTEWAGH